MLQSIKQFFEDKIAKAAPANDSGGAEHAYRLATAALLFEMTRADYEVKAEERRKVTDLVRRAFDLSPEETRELVDLAESEATEATSLYQFTNLINEHFSAEQKQHVVELLWEVAFADGELDKYEEYLVRKIADLIYVPHSGFMRAKHAVQARLGLA